MSLDFRLKFNGYLPESIWIFPDFVSFLPNIFFHFKNNLSGKRIRCRSQQFDPAAVARNLGVGDWGAPPPQVMMVMMDCV